VKTLGSFKHLGIFRGLGFGVIYFNSFGMWFKLMLVLRISRSGF